MMCCVADMVMDDCGVSSWEDTPDGRAWPIVSSLFVMVIVFGVHQNTGHLRSMLLINNAMVMVMAALRATIPI